MIALRGTAKRTTHRGAALGDERHLRVRSARSKPCRAPRRVRLLHRSGALGSRRGVSSISKRAVGDHRASTLHSTEPLDRAATRGERRERSRHRRERLLQRATRRTCQDLARRGGEGRGDGRNDEGPSERVALTGRIHCTIWERATGIEPATFSLGTSQEQPVVSTGYGALDLRGTFGTARALLAALAQGEQPNALAIELADRVLEEEAVRLALEVRNGGPHVWRRAIELAGVVLAAERAAMAVAEDS